ncbi:hypothetical protein LF300_004607 [Salmonella enterica]|nr:hypothetical protein [Salmonella enterica]
MPRAFPAYAFGPDCLHWCSGGCRAFRTRCRRAGKPAAPGVSAPLVLPEEGQARHALSADNHTTVSVKRVVFTDNPPGLKGLTCSANWLPT